jgi:uncharacterized protein YjbI with pentapeptide repeats
MSTAMRNAPLRRLMIVLASVLVIFAAFAAGIGLYAAALALWPWLLVWWPRLFAGAVAVVALGAWWSWWRLPKRQMRSITAAGPKDRADIEDNFRKTIGQLLGGAAVLIGAGLAYVQFTEQQRASREQFLAQQKTSQDQFLAQQKASQDQVLQQQRAAQDLLISNQVSKGFEQLGSHKVPIRLGGIYALEGVMNTSEKYHQPVLEALCAFVREGTRAVTGPPASDIQAVLTVIGRRDVHMDTMDTSERKSNYSLNLAGVHIPITDLLFANLSEADLRLADLRRANLGVANLLSADLGGANLRRASLLSADLRGANLSEADLSEADLGGADLSDTKLTGANLSCADLRGAKNLIQPQLDQACGTDAKLDPGLTLKPCP